METPPTGPKGALKDTQTQGQGSVDTLNKSINEFLRIRDLDRKILDHYRDTLLSGGEQFARIFYSYLLQFPATAAVLNDYRLRGHKLENLIEKQVAHLRDLLGGDISSTSANKMGAIGQAHYRNGVEPVWIMGAYLLYLDHLQTLIRSHPRIDEAHRKALEDTVTKLLFRDMGLMLEGYWDSSLKALQRKSNQIGQLRDQITSILSNIPQLLWSVDPNTNLPIYVSRNVSLICGQTISMPIPCLEWTLPEDRGQVEFAWKEALKGNAVDVESRIQDETGDIRWFRRAFNPYKDEKGRVLRIDGVMEDITETRTTISRLRSLATTDDLTGLLNRSLLYDRLQQAINLATRHETGATLILMDLDHFKEINDTLGHAAGDEILVMVANRLQTLLRESDSLARLGGDEFAVLLPNTRDRRIIRQVATKLLDCFNTPFIHQDNKLYLGASLGVACYPEHGDDVDSLMSRADIAMYSSKRNGNGYVFYDASDDPHTPERLQMGSELRHAILENQLRLYYQPKIDMFTGHVTGVEALVRWQHPERGLLTPDTFLPLVERAGLNKTLTDWVLRAAGAQCERWHQQGYRMKLAINVSGRVFQDPDFLAQVEHMVRETSAPSQYFEIEITENELMSDIADVSRILQRLSSLGITIAIDDFGTGYSSLAYLKELPLHTLKIDKSFVTHMTRNDNDAVIVRSMIDLAHNLGRTVVAEGIECRDTWDLLSILGCDGAQGYYISHPLPADKFGHWLGRSPWGMG